MSRRRHAPEQIVRKLNEADRMLNEGAAVAAVARHLQISEYPITAGGTSTAG